MKLDTLFQYRCYNEHPSIKAQGEALFAEFQSTRKRRIIDKYIQNKIRKAFKVALAGMYLGRAFDQYGSFVRILINCSINSPFQPICNFERSIFWIESLDTFPIDTSHRKWIPPIFFKEGSVIRVEQIQN
jgi:hypothetical protein